MHRIDPMNGERATAILVDFRHPLLKLEKKNLVVGNPLKEKKLPTMAGISKKSILRLWEAPPDVALLDSFHCTVSYSILSGPKSPQSFIFKSIPKLVIVYRNCVECWLICSP